MSVNNHDVKILLCGFYFQGNTGDDLLMKSIVETLSRHGEVKVTSTETFDVELLNWCQLLVIGAGSLITPRGIGGYEHAKYAKENGKKVVYYSQTIEEGHPQFREHLARADLITVRDSESKKVVEANGFRAVFASDPIFKMKKRSIGFSFRRWVNEPPGIVEKLASMLDNLAEDYEIFSLPYTEKDTDTESDASFHEQVIRHMKNKPKQAAYDDAIQRVDLFMGMRLHALINGVNMGKRVLAINYDTKVGRIFSDLAKNDGVVSYDDLEKIPYLVRNEIFRIDKLALREKVNEALVARICSDIRGEPGVKVSIVMPTYNRANYLKEAIDSILTQTIQDWELIIIDGGSTDNTKELVESYREGRIRYYNFGNNGISYSRNIGNLLSRGEIIAVADSDDINLPNRLEVSCKEMEKSKVDIIYSSMFHFDDTGKKELIPSHPFSYERLKGGNFIYHPTIACRRDVAMTCPYNEDLEMVEDYHFYLQAAEKGYKFHQVEEPLVMHRLHEEQISSVKGEEMAEIHRSLVDSVREKKERVSDPLVSVIVPTYNRPDMLKEALMSILSQTYQNFEVIVVNDAGEDVRDVIDALNKEGKIIYLQHEENKGLPAARNTGLKAAKGKYIAYLDDDDLYYPNHLETLVNFLEKSDYKVAYTDSYHVFQEWITDRYVTVGKKIIYSHDFDRQKLLVYNYIPVLNVIHRKDIIEVAGLYDVTLGAHEDWDMWIRLSQYGNFYHINKATTEVSVRTDKTTMTSRTRMPFLKTMEIIHHRYSHLVTHSSIFEEQKKAEEGLARQVEIEGKDSSIPIYEYLHRYRFVREFVRGKKVLNLACGEGDGSFMLSEEADSVIGIDIKDAAIRHASSNHIRENLTFIKGSITDIPIKEDRVFDVIVYFEGIKHNQEYDKLIMEVKRLLKPDGIFIVSISNKYLYSDVDDYGTPIHAKRLYLDDFKKLLSDHFKNILLYGQKVYPTSNIFPLYKEAGYSQDFIIEKGDEKFLFRPLEKRLASTFIALASDHIIDKSVVLGNSHLIDISETLFRQKDTSISLLEGIVREKDIHISNLEGIVTERGSEIESLRAALIEKERELSQRDSKVSELTGFLCHLESKVRDREATLNHIYNSHGWKALAIYYRLRDRTFPVNSKRRLFGKIILNALRKPKGFLANFNKNSPRKFIYYLKTSGPMVLEEKITKKLNNTTGGIEKRENRLYQESPLNHYKKNKKQHDQKPNKDYFNFLFEMQTQKSKDYIPISYPVIPETDIKLIAFYLPQFHPIPENDEWWGKGFTEWTNVMTAVPQFIGHYQPRLPGELGFYDLRIKQVLERQIELAKQYGIYGFCFHFYWFNAKRLLEGPLEAFLSNPKLNFPFCLNWANENWTRRWDGLDQEVLIRQNHSPEEDIAFIEYVSKYLKDDRYIRINSKPLLVFYRPILLPSPKKTAERWREWCHKNGIGEIYLALTHSFEHIDPREIGFDAAVEFAPNTFPLRDIGDQFNVTNREYEGKILDYCSALDFAKNYKNPEYKKFRGICPGWDNEARRPGRGTTLANSSPEAYKKWLKTLCDFTIPNFDSQERLIFINAWNEWAEAAYLEPDRKYGYAYLNRTAEVISSFAKEAVASIGNWKILFVSHDACRGGAQSVLLNTISWFKKHTFVDLKILCLDGGEWLHRFRELGDTLVLSELRKKTTSKEDILQKLLEFCGGLPDLIYGNSVATGREYRLFHQLKSPIITHFHELEMSIKRYAADWMGDVLKHSSHFIAISRAVQENLVKNHGVDLSKITTVHSSIDPNSSIHVAGHSEKRELRKKFGLEENNFLVFGCGIGMVFRKGADLFIEVARILRRKGFDDFHFYWIGDFDKNEGDERYGIWADHLTVMRKDGLDRYITFLGLMDNPRECLQAGDLFLVPSREEPFGLVALEAAECGLPTVCFADAGGTPEIVEQDAGFVVPYEDLEAMAVKVALLMKDDDLRSRLGIRAQEKLLLHFTTEQLTPRIFSACRKVASKKPAVSVIVPNYNHARYLPGRLDSIFKQTFKDFEVILLDDASTDNSMDVLERYTNYPDVRIIRNERNSGSPFKQWLKGIDLARSNILWIAESDDVCEPQFLETLLPVFRNPALKLAYADSHVIDENDKVTGDYSNGEYLTSLSPTKWKRDYQVTATQEINDGLGVKDTILNASAALFRTFEFGDEFRKTLEGMHIAGDWYFIVHAIKDGQIHYQADKLNCHRRHSASVIAQVVSGKRLNDFYQEFQTVQQFITQNYKLDSNFFEKWDTYMRKQWNDFCPNRPFDELKIYYPVNEMKQRIFLNVLEK